MNVILDPLRWAKFYATVKHAGQTYAGGLPYTHHLAAVEGVLRRFTCDLDLLEAAWLHDTMEDCGVKRKEIAEMFGPNVAKLVEAVTKPKDMPRKAANALNYPMIREAGEKAVALKLADRIANVEQGGNLVGMYQQEHEDFRRALFTPGENEEMWAHLDKLLGRAS